MRTENVELTVLCLIYDDKRYLLQNRIKKDWLGYTLPGGHIEKGESIVDAVIREMKEEIDFLVICGDYFDYRLQLNSKTTVAAIRWLDELIATCTEAGVKKIRIVKGTEGHDYDQLEAFRPTYEDSNGFFRIIK